MSRDYTQYITAPHKQAPNFVEWVRAQTKPFADIQTALGFIATAFDLDVAVGSQLDDVGRWVGVSRRLEIPLNAAFFSFDVAGLGWDEGYWKGPYEPAEGVVSLDDDAFRSLIRARVAYNYWNGSNEKLELIGATVLQFWGVEAYMLDNQDMTVTLFLTKEPPVVILELLKQAALLSKPAGVRLHGYIVATQPGRPLNLVDQSKINKVVRFGLPERETNWAPPPGPSPEQGAGLIVNVWAICT